MTGLEHRTLARVHAIDRPGGRDREWVSAHVQFSESSAFAPDGPRLTQATVAGVLVTSMVATMGVP